MLSAHTDSDRVYDEATASGSSRRNQEGESSKLQHALAPHTRTSCPSHGRPPPGGREDCGVLAPVGYVLLERSGYRFHRDLLEDFGERALRRDSLSDRFRGLDVQCSGSGLLGGACRYCKLQVLSDDNDSCVGVCNGDVHFYGQVERSYLRVLVLPQLLHSGRKLLFVPSSNSTQIREALLGNNVRFHLPVANGRVDWMCIPRKGPFGSVGDYRSDLPDCLLSLRHAHFGCLPAAVRGRICREGSGGSEEDINKRDRERERERERCESDRSRMPLLFLHEKIRACRPP
mmetsp:Transcript_15787/g.32017  ORF Transcript_15787/g.32017 Transcript_15787/m.32017 type:complete len:288 (+) Transcript_15787:873-1736(+)